LAKADAKVGGNGPFERSDLKLSPPIMFFKSMDE
jgi:hypothetical protein